MNKIVIDPQFEFLRDYIEALPLHFESLGTLMEARRNVIRLDESGGVSMVIKAFRRIYLANRIRYSFFASSKAERAFKNAKILIERGFNTPRPVAYIEVSRNGLISQSYFISENVSFRPLHMADRQDEGDRLELMTSLARLTWKLHQYNIYHCDYSLGNILFKKVGNSYEFSLVDNNRMKFGPVSVRSGIKNLVKLGLPVNEITFLTKEYARMRKIDEAQSLTLFFQFKRSELRKRQMKKSLKELVAGFKTFGFLSAIVGKSAILSGNLSWAADLLPL